MGIATGAASGIAVLDLDIKHPEALRWWRDNENRLPVTRTFRTRSGGVHLYYTYAPGIRCSTSRPVPGVDVKGDGGCVVSWWSAGFPCLDESPPAPWPAWLTATIWPPAPPAPPRRTERPQDDDAAVGGILRALSIAAEGGRNSVAFWAACRLRERGIGRGEAESMLLPAATAAGLDRAEVRATLASAWRRLS